MDQFDQLNSLHLHEPIVDRYEHLGDQSQPNGLDSRRILLPHTSLLIFTTSVTDIADARLDVGLLAIADHILSICVQASLLLSASY